MLNDDKVFNVSIGVEGIVANYNATVVAKDREDAEAKVREMFDDGNYDDAEMSTEDYSDAELMEGVCIEEV